MKKLVTCLVVVGLITMGGCKKSGERGGGAKKGEGFTLQTPKPLVGTSSMAREESKKFTITVKREADAKGDIKVTTEVPPELKLKPDKFTFDAGETNQEVEVTATKEAEVDKTYTIKFTGKADKGDPSPATLDIKIKKKKG